MTLKELACTYNFHDCDMMMPLDINDNRIVATFVLAKHLQYENFIQKHTNMMNSPACHIVITVAFTHYSDLKAVEEQYPTKKEKLKKNGKTAIKNVAIEAFDPQLDFRSLSESALEEHKVEAFFSDDQLKYGHISFFTREAVVLSEQVIDDEAYQKLLDCIETNSY